jgi:hydrogenase-4 component B
MALLIVALGLFVLGGVAALCSVRSPHAATVWGVGGILAGSTVGLIPTIRVLLGGETESFQAAWSVPYGSFSIGLDALSALFLVIIIVVSALAAVYGAEYWMAYREAKSLGAAWFFYDLLIGSMVLVVLARNAVLFLMAWEVMALASFFLVTFEDEREEVREAGWTYLVATHLGTAFVMVMFLLLGSEAGSLEFAQFSMLGELAPSLAGVLFMLAIVGFGTKAGFTSLHVWLPEAHPAAPSHVSAVMSGVMIKTGIYGLLRTLTWLGPPPPWWGWVLIGIGITSGILGVLFALAQHDLKRLLAYHSVENIGIIALGLGVGLLGVSAGLPLLATLGFAGGLLHVANHAIFKSLLFLGAGAVLHGTGTREMDHLGGLGKRMPHTALYFLFGAAAISGLPPLNGFVSEFLIFIGALDAGASADIPVAIPALAVLTALALIGGLAAACFTKAFGVVFLGEPRSDHVGHAHEVGLAMRVPMALLAAACVLIGLLAPWVVIALAPVLGMFGTADASLAPVLQPLRSLVGIAAGVWILVGLLVWLRLRLLRHREIGASVTWDCGYARPTARMQYSSSSFAQPLTGLFAAILRPVVRGGPPSGLFPEPTSFASQTPDLAHRGVFAPVFAGIDRAGARLRWLQHGNVHLYVLYIALTLLVLLVWQLA